MRPCRPSTASSGATNWCRLCREPCRYLLEGRASNSVGDGVECNSGFRGGGERCVGQRVKARGQGVAGAARAAAVHDRCAGGLPAAPPGRRHPAAHLPNPSAVCAASKADMLPCCLWLVAAAAAAAAPAPSASCCRRRCTEVPWLSEAAPPEPGAGPGPPPSERAMLPPPPKASPRPVLPAGRGGCNEPIMPANHCCCSCSPSESSGGMPVSGPSGGSRAGEPPRLGSCWLAVPGTAASRPTLAKGWYCGWLSARASEAAAASQSWA